MSQIRIQKSRSGMYVQLVLVKHKEGQKLKKFYSISYYQLLNYLTGKNNCLFLTAEEMFTKDSEKYKQYQAEKKLIKKVKLIAELGGPIAAKV